MARRQVAVVCESTACLPADVVSTYEIGVVPVPFVIDGTTFRDGVDITADTFYARLAHSALIPKTSPPEPGAYLEAFRSAACDQVVIVTVASRIGTFERSVRAAESLAARQLPRLRVQVLDSGSAAMGQGFVAMAAARAACRGLDLDAVCRAAEAIARRVNLVVALDTLHYLARTSRIPQIASLVSSVLDLKPIIRLANGEVHALARVRSRQRSLDRLVDAICELTPAQQPLNVAVQHARALAEAERTLARLSERRPLNNVYLTEFTPVMGAYCGPGLVGAAFYPCEEFI